MEVPAVHWDEVGGLEEVKEDLKEAEILTIPPVEQECLKDYDRLSETLNNLEAPS